MGWGFTSMALATVTFLASLTMPCFRSRAQPVPRAKPGSRSIAPAPLPPVRVAFSRWPLRG